MTDLALRSAVELVGALKKGEVGSRELLDHYLARIERLNGALNAVVTLDVERARRAADAADTARTRGLATLGPLHGLPMTVKDTLETAGLRTTAGATLLSGHVPGSDAVVVERARAAGAIVFGKTNTPTYASDVQTYNPIFGITRNPWNRERTCGGSSGGAAVAIAAGLTGAEIGSDIGGSIRGPAHCCGVYGHKPTHGIVPSRGHIPGPPGSLGEYDLGVMGPLARSADDLVLLLDVLAGPDAADAVGWRLALPPPRQRALRDYRVAVWMDDPFSPVDTDVQALGAAAVAALRSAGVSVDEDARPIADLGAVHRLYEKLLWPILSGGMTAEEVGELARVADATPPDDTNLFDRFTRAVTLRARDWIAVDEERQHIRRGWAEFFTRFDVLLCPIWPVPAITHDHGETLLARTIRVNGLERSYIELIVWAGMVSMALLPATAVPIGRTPVGLPVGLQIVGPYLEDRTPLDFARRLADVVGGYVPPPGV